MTRLLATVLPEVNGRPGKPGPFQEHRAPDVAFSGAEIDADSAIAEFERGREEGLAQGRAEARAAVEAAKRAWHDEHAQCLQESRHNADLIAARIETAVEAFAGTLSDRIAELLGYLVREQISRDAIEAVASKLESKIRGGEIGRIRVFGDQSLMEHLRRQQETRGGWDMFEFSQEAQEGAELRVDLDIEMLETQIQPWLAQVDELCRTK